MEISYAFSTASGDLPLGLPEMKRPFLTGPRKAHPFLTVGDYFDCLRDFLLKDKGTLIVPILSRALKENELKQDDILRLLIRSEKHGSLYHVSSIEINTRKGPFKMALSAALTEDARRCLFNDGHNLTLLGERDSFSYLPEVYACGESEIIKGESSQTIGFLLSGWLDQFHEWHLSRAKDVKEPLISLWDPKSGPRFLEQDEAYHIFRNVSMILTLYFDPETFRQIYPWHHSAGDFVVKTGKRIEVRLTTVRNYIPVIEATLEKDLKPILSLIYFLLHMLLMIRIDRLDGVGEIVWAGPFSIKASLEGFFDALSAQADIRTHTAGSSQILSLLKSFSGAELLNLYVSLLSYYSPDDTDEISAIQTGLQDHVKELEGIIRNFQL